MEFTQMKPESKAMNNDLNYAGDVRIPRQFFMSSHWTEKRVFNKAEAYLYILANIRYSDTVKKELIHGRMVAWGKGQMLGSVRFLSKAWGWSIGKVQRYLELLESEQLIIIDKTQQIQVIRIFDAKTIQEQVQQTIQQQVQQNPLPESVTADSRYTNEYSERNTEWNKHDTRTGTKQKESSNKEEKKKNKEQAIPYGHGSPLFISEYDSWITHRRELKKPVTASSMKSQNEFLNSFPEHEAIEMIKRAIRGSWSGFFELKPEDKTKVRPALPATKPARKTLKDFWNESDYQAYIAQEDARDANASATDMKAIKYEHDFHSRSAYLSYLEVNKLITMEQNNELIKWRKCF